MNHGKRYWRWYVSGGLLLVICVVLWIAAQKADAPAPMSPAGDVKSATRAAPKTGQSQPATNVTFPAGKRTLLPEYRLVALYGAPGAPSLGVLGEAPLNATLDRAKALAGIYQNFTTQKTLPTLEIITTVASAAPGEDGDYSRETSPDQLKPWITAARQAGVYVVLDLQPGRSDFLSQAKQYESLLSEPNVGLALDPEWRLAPDQVHLRQIGSVSIQEVNEVADWLSMLTQNRNLPQKVLLLHQFRLSMIRDRANLNTSHKNLAYIIQMDGNGAQSTKLDTWRTIQTDLPQGVNMGWKNFYDEDHPLLDPQGTMALSPVPWYISYQ